MSKPNSSPIRIQFGFRGWAAIAVAMAILAAFALLAVGLLVFLLPALLIAPILYRLMPTLKPNPISHTLNNDILKSANDAEIVEGEFTVVNTTAVEHHSKLRDESQS
jgi:hypothetical protein